MGFVLILAIPDLVEDGPAVLTGHELERWHDARVNCVLSIWMKRCLCMGWMLYVHDREQLQIGAMFSLVDTPVEVVDQSVQKWIDGGSGCVAQPGGSKSSQWKFLKMNTKYTYSMCIRDSTSQFLGSCLYERSVSACETWQVFCLAGAHLSHEWSSNNDYIFKCVSHFQNYIWTVLAQFWKKREDEKRLKLSRTTTKAPRPDICAG